MYSIYGSESCGDIKVRTVELERDAHRDPADLEHQL